MTTGTPPTTGTSVTARPAAGPLVIFDLDGVISDATHRQHFLRGTRMDYRWLLHRGGP